MCVYDEFVDFFIKPRVIYFSVLIPQKIKGEKNSYIFWWITRKNFLSFIFLKFSFLLPLSGWGDTLM